MDGRASLDINELKNILRSDGSTHLNIFFANSSEEELAGVATCPWDKEALMHLDDDCTDSFTPRQVARMHCYLDLVYQGSQPSQKPALITLAPQFVGHTVGSVMLEWFPPLAATSLKENWDQHVAFVWKGESWHSMSSMPPPPCPVAYQDTGVLRKQKENPARSKGLSSHFQREFLQLRSILEPVRFTGEGPGIFSGSRRQLRSAWMDVLECEVQVHI